MHPLDHLSTAHRLDRDTLVLAPGIAPGHNSGGMGDEHAMVNCDLNWIANYIPSIADGALSDPYVRGKYRDVLVPAALLRRLVEMLEDGQQAVLNT